MLSFVHLTPMALGTLTMPECFSHTPPPETIPSSGSLEMVYIEERDRSPWHEFFSLAARVTDNLYNLVKGMKHCTDLASSPGPTCEERAWGRGYVLTQL